jgi:WD40 repeat protein
LAHAARSADWLVLVTLGNDQTVQTWTQRPRPGPLIRLAQLDAAASSIAVAPGGATLAVGANDGVAYLLDAVTGHQLSRLTGHDGSVTGLAFDGSSRLVTGDSAGTLRVWDVGTAHVRVEHRGAHHGAIRALAIKEGRLLVSGGADGTVRLWNPSALTAAGPPPAELHAPVTDVAIGPDGATVAASTEHGDVALWTTEGRPIGSTFRVTNDAVWAVALGGGGDTLAAAAADEVLSVWSLAQDRQPSRTHELGSHRGGALDAAFVDPTVVVVSSHDGKLHLWDAVSGQAIGSALAVSASPIWHVATSADGTIWTASHDGTITRIDALALDAACAEAGGSFDARQRARLLAGRAPLACRSNNDRH